MMKTVEVKISGEVYKTSTRYSIKQQAGDVSVSDIDVLVSNGQRIPRAMEQVQILFDDVPFFFGIVQTVESPDYSSGKESARYRLTVQSGEVMFQWRLVSESLDDVYTHDIIQTLFDNYIASEGITLGKISVTERFYQRYTASYLKLSDCLKELSDAIGASVSISADKKFYFLTQDAIEQINAPENITALKLEEAAVDLRTVQIVTGASEETSQQTQQTTWAEGQKTVTLGYQVSSFDGATINGTICGVGVIGLDEEDVNKTFLYKFSSQVVTLNNNALIKPVAGDNVVMVYKGFFDIIVTNTNDQLRDELKLLNGSSGNIESLHVDETLTTFGDADSVSRDLLTANGARDQTITVTCKDINKSGLFLSWYINRTDLGIVGNFVIVERAISDFGDTWLIRLKLKNKGFFSRYGTVLKKVEKVIRPESLVYKQTSIGDTATSTDSFIFDIGNMIYFPTSGALLSDPELPGFYPL